MPNRPDYLLYAQHGWADTYRAVAVLAQAVASPQAKVIVPNLGFLKTWWRIEPLIEQLEAVAMAEYAQHPDTPKRIVGHSMGGLLWLEVLQRHPEWWPLVDSLILVGSPVGGAHLGRMVDPLQLGIGIARDLGLNRRPLAEAIAQQVPTLIIASDYDGGSDGIVTVQCTQFRHARYLELPGIGHAHLRYHPLVAQAVKQFWQAPTTFSPLLPTGTPGEAIIRQLQAIPGITDAPYRDFAKAPRWAGLTDGFSLRLWIHPLGVPHVFLADHQQRCRFAGFVGWLHVPELYAALDEIRAQFGKG
jgi:pimeloyl-ACP methyl ester carboxylesterase